MQISMSLYGTNPKYLMGAVQNAKSRLDFYPTSELIIYFDRKVPKIVLDTLRNYDVKLFSGEETGLSNPMMWRFLPAFKPGDKTVIVRDTDSRFTERERAAVEEWLRSDRTLHIMRDHPMHEAPILGGMWGIQGATPGLQSNILMDDETTGQYGADQRFLARHLYYPFRNSRLVHDEFFCFEQDSQCFPLASNAGEFVGESYNEREEYDVELRKTNSRTTSRLTKTKRCLKVRIKLLMRRYT